MSEKLVRDKMPEICNKNPEMTDMSYRLATEEEMLSLLTDKLHEEVAELMELIKERGKGTKTLYDLGEELADIKEVLESIATHCGLLEGDIDIIQRDKRSVRGSFKNGIVWDGVK
jgi:predicted house-cleaning noncanonical NTP pyrophosphatase (MazG superfamily)